MMRHLARWRMTLQSIDMSKLSTILMHYMSTGQSGFAIQICELEATTLITIARVQYVYLRTRCCIASRPITSSNFSVTRFDSHYKRHLQDMPAIVLITFEIVRVEIVCSQLLLSLRKTWGGNDMSALQT